MTVVGSIAGNGSPTEWWKQEMVIKSTTTRTVRMDPLVKAKLTEKIEKYLDRGYIVSLLMYSQWTKETRETCDQYGVVMRTR
jgi:hypothetical protein